MQMKPWTFEVNEILKRDCKSTSSDPPCKDVNVWSTMVTFKRFVWNQVWMRDPCFCLFSFQGSLQKWLAHFLHIRSNRENIKIKHLSNKKNDDIFHNFDHIKVSMVPLWISLCLCMEIHLQLRFKVHLKTLICP